MLIIVIGKNKSGKSLFAEEILAGVKSNYPKYYIGTLPKLKIYNKRIYEHKKRRPIDWLLKELSGNMPYDTDFLSDLSPGIVLLDGLSIYLYRIYNNSFVETEYILKLTTDWLKNAFIGKHYLTILVDSQPYKQNNSDLNRMIKSLHEELIKEADKSYLVNNGNIQSVQYLSLNKILNQ